MAKDMTLTASVRADASGFVAGMKQAGKAADEFAGKTKKAGKDASKAIGEASKSGLDAGKAIAAGIAGTVIVKGIKDAISAASDLNETVSKAQQIFGEAARELDAWSTGAAQAFGQSKQQALDAASTFGIFGKSAGLAGTKLTDFSKEMTSLASDLASFNNTSVDDAIVALGAAMRGETEPIRRYGVLLDDASLRQAAFEAGIISTTKNALTPQQRVLAAHILIMKQTKDAQGDFARTADGLANSQRILSAEWKNAQAAIGQALLPAMKSVVSVITLVVGGFNNLSPTTQKTVLALGALAAAAIIIPKVFMAIKGAIMGTNPWLAAVSLAIGTVIAVWARHQAAAQRTKEEADRLAGAFENLNSQMIANQRAGQPLVGVYQGIADAMAATLGEEKWRNLTTAMGHLRIPMDDVGKIMAAMSSIEFRDTSKPLQKDTQAYKDLAAALANVPYLIYDVDAAIQAAHFGIAPMEYMTADFNTFTDLTTIKDAAGDTQTAIKALSEEVYRSSVTLGQQGIDAASVFRVQIAGVTDLNTAWQLYEQFIQAAVPVTQDVADATNGIDPGKVEELAKAWQDLIEIPVTGKSKWQGMVDGVMAVSAEWATGAKRAEVFGDALAALASPQRAAISSASALAQAQEDFNRALGKRTSKKGKVTFKKDVHLGFDTADARATTDAFLALGDAMQADVLRVLETSGSYDQARDSAKWYREELTAQLAALGMNKEAITEYLTAVGLTPEQVETAIKLTGEQEAMQKVQIFSAFLDPSSLPREVQTAIMVDLNENDMAGVWATLTSYFSGKAITVPVKPVTKHPEVKRSATGGSTGANGTIVGERGTEFLTDPGYVVNHQRLMQAAQAGIAGIVASPAVAPSGGGGSTSVVNVTAHVTVGPGGDPNEAARVIVDIVNKYQRSGGTRFVQPTVRTN